MHKLTLFEMSNFNLWLKMCVYAKQVSNHLELSRGTQTSGLYTWNITGIIEHYTFDYTKT